jgi:S-adenosylmethionine:diacylglycerol 3-amino-3-carboxypropyl transferase
LIAAQEQTPGKTAKLIGAAVHRSRLLSREGLRERAFTLAFSSLVYPQIWEDRRWTWKPWRSGRTAA